MDAIQEVKKSLYESYKMLYEDTVTSMKKCLSLAKKRRECGEMGWAADWLKSANFEYKMAISYKRSMKVYAS